MLKKRGLIVFVAVWQLALCAPSQAAEGLEAEPTIQPNSPNHASDPIWRSLRYRGRNWLGNMSAQLEIKTQPPNADSPPTSGAARGVAELRTRFDSFVFANRSTFLRALFDRSTGEVFQFTKRSLGRRPDFKRFDFRPGGVDRLRLEPRSGELSLPAERWSASRRSFHAWLPEQHDCRLVSDPGAMAYLLSSDSNLLNESTEKARFCFFSGKTLYRVEFIDLGSSRKKVNYRMIEDGVDSNRSGRLMMNRYGILARPVAGELDETPIRAEISIEADSGIPWRFLIIEGWLRVDVELDQVILGEPRSSRLSITPHEAH